jgi:cytochrome c oxidase assembly protein subunit 11
MSPPSAPASTAANRRLAWVLALAAAGFLGFGFALVPLYNTFCELTGLNGRSGNGTGALASAPPAARWVTVNFTSTVMPGLPWSFAPKQHSLRVHPGELATAFYTATNLAHRPLDGQAVMSVSPEVAARHFKKTECFCFKRQALQPGETRTLPLAFFIDTDLPDEVRTITLSYAFFPIDGRKP